MPRAAAVLALQQSFGNAAVCRVLARQGFAPRELPVLGRPLELDLDQYPGRDLEAEQHRLREQLAASESYPGRAEELWRLEAIDARLRSQRRAFEARLEQLLPEVKAALTRDDDRMRVDVQRVWIDPDSSRSFTTHVVYATIRTWQKIPVSSYTSPAAAGQPVSVKGPEKTVTVLEGDFRTNELHTPEAGLVSEGLGPLEFLWIPGAARSLGQLGFKLAGKQLAKRRAARAGGERLELFHGTEQRGLEGIGAVGRGRIDVRFAAGEHQDLGRGFYLTTDSETAAEYAMTRAKSAGGAMQHTLSFEVSLGELGKVVDIRGHGRFRGQWEKFLDEDAYATIFGTPLPWHSTTVRSFLTSVEGIERRGIAFERFLQRIGMRNADTIIAPLGDDVFTGITAGRITTQVCIRSQRTADRLNAIIRGEP